jgi:hypothetical protein
MKPLRFLRTLGQMTVGQATARIRHELWLRKRKPLGWPAGDENAALSQAHLPPPRESLPRLKQLSDLWQRGRVEYVGLEGGNADWSGADKPKLWRYERHYHSELVALAVQAVEYPHGPWVLAARELQDEWALATPPETGDAWEPYPTARRILSWAEAAALEPAIAAPQMAGRLAFQLRHLSAHLEHHLRGNHLICDAAALVAGGAMLAGPQGDAALREGSALLSRELKLQVLRDGGYAERTFQYHALVLKDALLALELAAARAPKLRQGLSDPIAKMALWLWQTRRMETPSGASWPLVNDASPQAFALADEVLVRATRMQLFSEPPRSSAVETTLEETGWTFLRDARSELFFDFGNIGPRDQPGHGHDDALAYELRWDGLPVVTDSGVTTYDVNEARAFERSPMAHATVSVDGRGIDEIWSSFRVGGRGSVKLVEATQPSDRVHILGGKAKSTFGFTHQRALVFWPSRALLVFDRVTGTNKNARVLSHIPLDPAWSAAEAEGTVFLLGPGAVGLQLLLVRGAFDHLASGVENPRDGWVGRGFGKPIARTSISLRTDEDGQCLYAIVAPGVSVRQTARGLALRAPGAEEAFELEGFKPAQSASAAAEKT